MDQHNSEILRNIFISFLFVSFRQEPGRRAPSESKKISVGASSFTSDQDSAAHRRLMIRMEEVDGGIRRVWGTGTMHGISPKKPHIVHVAKRHHGRNWLREESTRPHWNPQRFGHSRGWRVRMNGWTGRSWSGQQRGGMNPSILGCGVEDPGRGGNTRIVEVEGAMGIVSTHCPLCTGANGDGETVGNMMRGWWWWRGHQGSGLDRSRGGV